MIDTIIIGGGASGMMAAICAGRRYIGTNEGTDADKRNASAAFYSEDAARKSTDTDPKVLLLEQKDRLGKKVLATGNGKCNYTNEKMDPAFFFGHPELIRRTYEKFNHSDTIAFFREIGVYPKVKNGYCYPASEQASSVVWAMETEIRRLPVEIHVKTKVEDIVRTKSGFTVKTNKGEYTSRHVILACGLKASPKLGSDGSLFPIIKKLGHHMTPLRPALCGFNCRGINFAEASGVRCDCEISLKVQGKIIASDFGEVQFTDYGLSGIPVFQLSHRIGEYIAKAQEAETQEMKAQDLTIRSTKAQESKIQGAKEQESKSQGGKSQDPKSRGMKSRTVSCTKNVGEKITGTDAYKQLISRSRNEKFSVESGITGTDAYKQPASRSRNEKFSVESGLSENADNGRLTYAVTDTTCQLELSLLPELSQQELRRELALRSSKNSRFSAESLLMALLPQKLIPSVLSQAGISMTDRVSSLQPEKLDCLAETVKHFVIVPVSARDFDSAQVCAGGIPADEVDPNSLESRLVPGLFFSGEVLDVDAICGGYNLQWAWSSGYTAGFTGEAVKAFQE